MCPHQTWVAQGAHPLLVGAACIVALASCRTMESPAKPVLGEAVPSSSVRLATAHRPTAATLSADGQTLYLLAMDDAGSYQLFRGAVGGSLATVPTSPALSYPVAVQVSRDDALIVVVDHGDVGSEAPTGAVYAGPVGGGLSRLGGNVALTYPTAAVLASDGQTAYITGRVTTTLGAEAALWQVSLAGGDATTLHRGAPLIEPIGLTLASDGSLYIADGQAGPGSRGAIFRRSGEQLAQINHPSSNLAFPCGLSAAGRSSPDLLFTTPTTTNAEAWLHRLSPDGTVQDVTLPALTDPTCLARAAAADRWVAIESVVPSSSPNADPLDVRTADGAVWLLSP